MSLKPANLLRSIGGRVGSDADACAWRGNSDKGGKTGCRSLKAFRPVESEANVCAVVMLCYAPPKVRSSSRLSRSCSDLWVWARKVPDGLVLRMCHFPVKIANSGGLCGMDGSKDWRQKKGPKNACQAGMCG